MKISIRTYLLLLVAAVSIPLAGVIGYGIYRDTQNAVDQAKASMRILVTVIAKNAGSRMAGARATLERLAARPMVKAVDESRCDSALKDLHSLYPGFSNIVYTDLTGRAVCSAVPQPEGKPVNVGKTTWFRKFMAEKRFTVGQPHIGPITGRWVSVLSVPIWNDSHEIVGAIHLPLDLSDFDPQIPGEYLPADSRYGFLGQDGTVIWQNVDPQKIIGTRPGSEAARRLLEMGDGQFEAAGVDSVTRFFSAATVSEAGWVAFVGVPTTAIYAQAKERALSSAGFGLLGLLCLNLLAIAIARRIEHPVASLARASRAIRTGNFNVRALPSGPVELSTVAQEFNAMVESRLCSERKLRESEARLRAERDRSQLYLDTVPAVVVALDRRGCVTMINPFGCKVLGYRAEELLGQNWFTTCLPQPEGRHTLLPYFEHLMAGKAENQEYAEQQLVTASGRNILVAWHIALLRDGAGEVIGTLNAGEDITEQRAAEEAIHNLAFFDPLSGLPNRRLLVDRLQHSMAASTRSSKYRALLFLDLDRFKSLNDSLGHDLGDRLLVETARRLQACVREGDTVSRLGGDEFVVLLEQLSTDREEAANQAGGVAESIMERLRQPCDLGHEIHRSTASIGITVFIGHEVSVDEVLKRADLAMYQAKSAGRNTLRFFDPAMQATIDARAALEKDLRHAVEAGEFALHYQPQVDSAGKCIGIEALIRWKNPKDGFISPAEFIPLAEETGLIVPIGYWVLREACARLAQWSRDPLTAALSVAVNVSARQFREAGFVDEACAIVRASGADPARLKLEITESVLVDNIEDAIVKMLALRDVGIAFALDDFGTGYSSLSYVKRLPLDQLKIDQSFVRDVLVDPNDAAICRAIIALGDSLGLDIIAEGVETAGQWEFLAAEGCRSAQGYLYARPMPADDLIDWLKKGGFHCSSERE